MTVSVPRKEPGHAGGDELDGGAMTRHKVLEGYAKQVAKVGKRKNWIRGHDGWGMAVEVVLADDLLD